jgi:competence protein ComEC
VGEVDVYQATHHGAEDSNHPVLLRAAAPTVAIVNNGPRKGGKAEAYRRLRELPRPPDVFQVHRNVETTADDNAPPAYVANDDEACRGEWVRLRVDDKARSYRVEVPAKGTSKTYQVR